MHPAPHRSYLLRAPLHQRVDVALNGYDPVQRGGLKRSAHAVQLFGRLAVLETHTLRY